MLSSSPLKKENAKHLRKAVNKSPTFLAVGSKPLNKLRFYLDVKNRVTTNKLEAKLKELGGNLELFLIRDVTHVVTDRKEWCNTKGGGSNPKTPRTASNEPYNDDSNASFEGTPTRGRPKTRADAMLERARLTSTVVSKDPLDEAKSWGIAIWTVEQALVWLEKVTLSIKSGRKKDCKVFPLKAPFIKFEAFDRQTRPVFQEICNWPALNFQGSAGDPGVKCRSLAEHNMTRKTRSNHPRVDTALQPGYCEVCRAEYPRFDEHLESKKHLNFIKDDANFIQLDSLIRDTSNIDSFLKLNIDDKCNGLNPVSISTIRNKMPRTRTTSLCDKIKNSPLSPTGSDSGHRLRSRRHIALTSSYLGSTAEDDGQPIKPEGAREIRELRSSTRQLLRLAEHEAKDTWDSGRPKRTCIKQKRISADERLVVDNRSYYKVEVLSNKLRSSGVGAKDLEVHNVVETPIPEESEPVTTAADSGLIVKFKRMRTSELKQLNNEAENFLFPKRDDSSSDEDVDGDGPDTTVSVRDGDSTLLLSSESDEPLNTPVCVVKHEDEVSMDSNCSESVKKKKRRTHAEAFILDNQKYYKFETPGSRLRYHGSYLAPMPPTTKLLKHNGEYASKNGCTSKANKLADKEKPEKHKTPAEDKVTTSKSAEKINLNDISFSFETIPKSEPWYQTFKRQDQGQEYYTCFSDSGYWKPLLLPYQMGPLPPLDPRICIKAYQEVKKQFVDTPSASTSAGCTTPDSNCADSISPELIEDASKTSEDSNIEATTDGDKLSQDDSNRYKRRKAMMVGKNPRKSPRQHASTLAILSSLIHQRKRRADLNKSKCEVNASKLNLPSIAENAEEVKIEASIKVHETDYDLTIKKMDDVLLNSLDSYEEMELISDDNSLSGVCFKMNAMEMLEQYDNQRGEGGNPVKRVYASGKKPGRKKKKKNRTGWPNKNRRLKKGVVKEELDDSTVDSVSVNADSDENDNCDQSNVEFSDLNGGVNNSESEFVSGVTKLKNSVKHAVMNVNDDQSNAHTNVQTNNPDGGDRQDRVNASSKHDDSCAEIVIASEYGKNDRVVALDKWENAEKVLSAKLTNNEINSDVQFQPYVRVQKLAGDVSVKCSNRRLRSSSSPHRTLKRARRMPASPKSPRTLRKPRGRWYRER